MKRDVRFAAAEAMRVSAPAEKTTAARSVCAAWRAGDLAAPAGDAASFAPDEPGRPPQPVLVSPGEVPRRRLSSREGRIALLHAVAHIEFNAVDLALDMVARFAGAPEFDASERDAFVTDWLDVADDEARHFVLLEERLGALGARYGDLPAHGGLWRAARTSADDLAARLAIAPLVLEARGLDVTPGMIDRLRAAGDEDSAGRLEIIHNEEHAHVAAGVRWFERVCEARGLDPASTFQAFVQRRFAGGVKPPINRPARRRAGLPDAYYDLLLREGTKNRAERDQCDSLSNEC